MNKKFGPKDVPIRQVSMYISFALLNKNMFYLIYFNLNLSQGVVFTVVEGHVTTSKHKEFPPTPKKEYSLLDLPFCTYTMILEYRKIISKGFETYFTK